MAIQKILPIALSLAATYATQAKSFGSEPMECSDDECEIDYSGAKPLNLVIPEGIKKVTLSYNGSGRIKVKTKDSKALIDKLVVDCVGSARANLSELHAKEAKVKYRGSADLDIYVRDKAVIQNSGSGDINISGTAKVEVTGSGSGKVTRDEE